ncbi:MarP family serine protease [Paeniglutamicibacter cryotolerans]|uniref:S1-C subfamily serine protease n=1 Tax=Paeniglutamicibacter cryotolerans TaxID=670079 RepID=A0A839QDI3_9MICC|nr:MarP family serine protease [Paeniglutamicibacter cryotolerans]MBB2994248.1 S1-C subfamily serine protease [Paeniglutamicibacter cryotolerans]
MLFGFTWLDLLLLISLAGFLVSGLRKGFFVTLGAIAGFVAGGTAAFFAIPLVSTWVASPGWRLFWVIASAIVLILIGQGIGAAIGRRIRLWLNLPALRTFDRILGGVANTVVASLVISAIAYSVSTMGMPFISQQIASSQVLGTIKKLTPEPVESFIAQARSIVMGDTIPELFEPFAPTSNAPAPGEVLLGGAIERAAASVVKITGTALACGVNQSGSGFVAANDRVLTNAHVVSGIDDPVVNTQDGRALPATVVYFDEVADTAVLTVPGLSLAPLDLGRDLAPGDDATFMGFPAGGPFKAQGAVVESLRSVMVQDIHGQHPSLLKIYQLAAAVHQGNSGGPLLDAQGKVVGMVFAKAKGEAKVGYALSLQEIAPVVVQAGSRVSGVDTGACSAH